MIGNLYFGISKKVRIFIIFLLIILVFYFIGRFIFIRLNKVPLEFFKARQEASLIAHGIVKLSTDSAERVGQISNLNDKQNYTEALNLVTREMEKNREIRQKAIELSANLEIMARSTAKIYPDSSARVALEAVSIETTLISQLVDYSDYLNQLLEILRAKLLGQSNSHDKINELIKKINAEAKTVNELNQKFNDLMNQFDNNK
ncbi:MAG: hypothetical protein AAB757_01245 [Patescibacteria group bacterium]